MTKEEREKRAYERFTRLKNFDRELTDDFISSDNMDGCHAERVYLGGVDEAGRGPLAGPVVAACVVLRDDFDIAGVDDSKKISEKKREELFDKIISGCIAYGIGILDNEIIDRINILEAAKGAMAEAVKKADDMLRTSQDKGMDLLALDAVRLNKCAIRQFPFIKGDSKSLSIAAASIVAKVTRDRIMRDYHEKYPQYGFDRNKGYGTAAHYSAIKEFGITPIHRRTFLKNIDLK